MTMRIWRWWLQVQCTQWWRVYRVNRNLEKNRRGAVHSITQGDRGSRVIRYWWALGTSWERIILVSLIRRWSRYRGRPFQRRLDLIWWRKSLMILEICWTQRRWGNGRSRGRRSWKRSQLLIPWQCFTLILFQLSDCLRRRKRLK